MVASSSSGPRIIPKENTVSLVWTYFGLEPDTKGKLISKDIAICRVCNSKSTTKGGSTSNLFSHLKNHHPMEYANLKEISVASSKPSMSSHQPSSSSQPTIMTIMEKVKPYNRYGKKWQD